MDGRILILSTLRLALLRNNLEAQGATYEELPKADRILDKLQHEGDVSNDVLVEIPLTNDEYEWVHGRWKANTNLMLAGAVRKHILAISDALREAPGYTVRASESGVTVERESAIPPNSDPTASTA